MAPYRYKYSKYIDPYISLIKENKVEHCIEQEQMLENIVIPMLERKDVYIDEEKIEKGLALQKYFPYTLIEWEIFLFALIAGTFFKDGDIVWDDIRMIVGRGSGKNGFISFLAFYFLSPVHGIQGYNVDLLANSEGQAKTSFKDVYEIITDPTKEEFKNVLKTHYNATKEIITGKKTKSELRFNTSSKRGKDSKRTGCVIYDEKHEYMDDTNMNTLRSGLGKVWHGREITITTDGHNRGGVLDKEKEENKDILKKYDPENRTLVFWCRIEKEDEWKDIEKMVKAIPSLNDFKSLKNTIKKEIKKMPYNPDYFREYMAKRCNMPIDNKDEIITEWKNLEAATAQKMIDTKAMKCIGSVDYAQTNDFAAVGLLFRKGEKVYFKQHTFICSRSRDLPGMKIPIDEWKKNGSVEIVDDILIPPRLIAGWFAEQKKLYAIKEIRIDNYRYMLLSEALKEAGFSIENKKIHKMEGKEIMMCAPLISAAFTRQNIVFDSQIMRWYTWNAKKLIDSRGNITYGKIEPIYRKTDGFMAFVHAFTGMEQLPKTGKTKTPKITMYTG